MAENQAGPAAELSSCLYGIPEMFYYGDVLLLPR